MAQTAVDWLVSQQKHNKLFDIETIEQAKQMEKVQIMKAVYDGMGTNFDPNMGRAEQYYKEIYENNK